VETSWARPGTYDIEARASKRNPRLSKWFALPGGSNPVRDLSVPPSGLSRLIDAGFCLALACTLSGRQPLRGVVAPLVGAARRQAHD
jgi:hypothetical protein